MNVFLYMSKARRRVGVFLRKDLKIEEIPKSIFDAYQPFAAQQEFELTPDGHHIALEDNEAISAINQVGYFVAGASITATEREGAR